MHDHINRRRALALGSIVAGSLLSAASGVPAAAATDPNQRLILKGATIVSTHDGTLSRDMTLVIAAGKIARIAPAAGVPADRSARTIDARGLFVVPGYNDLHAYPLSTSDPEGALNLMLANGITGFRQIAASPEMLAARAQGKLMPPVEAPELLEMPGSLLAGPNASAPEVVLAEPHELDSVLVGCSTDEPALRASMAQTPLPSRPTTAAALRRFFANPTVDTPASEFVRYQRVIDTFSAPRSLDLAAHFVAAGTWLDPTLIRLRTMEYGDDELYWNDPNLRYVPKATRAMWEDVSREFTTKLSAPARATLKSLFALQTSLVKPFKAAGVKMLAGSDVGGGFVIPGFSLHQEFDLLEEAGLGALDVLQMTTLNGAQFLGRESTMGSVDEGKDANLVILTDDPMVSVQNLHNISAVVRAGRYYSAADLDGMKKKAERRAATGDFAAFTAAPCGCSA